MGSRYSYYGDRYVLVHDNGLVTDVKTGEVIKEAPSDN